MLVIQGLAKSNSTIFQILITNGHVVKLVSMLNTQNGTTNKSQYWIQVSVRNNPYYY